MATVKFLSEKYGNYQDSYYTKNYEDFITTLQGRVVFSQDVNLGVTDGVVIENNFKGNFHNINCAIVEHEDYGTHLYKIIKKQFIRKNIWRITMIKDMVSAKWNEILDSDVLVSRLGISTTTYDELLFIPEELKLSEVKRSHIPLRGLQGANSWGYLMIWKRNELVEGNDIRWTPSRLPKINYDYQVTNINTDPFILELLKPRRTDYNNTIYYVLDDNMSIPHYKMDITAKPNGEIVSTYEAVSSNTEFNIKCPQYSHNRPQSIYEVLKSTWGTYNEIPRIENDVRTGYTAEDGKVIFDGTNYYEIRSYNTVDNQEFFIPENTFNQTLRGDLDTEFVKMISVFAVETYQRYKLEALISGEENNGVPLGTFANCLDQPFTMIYTPMIENGQMRYNDITMNFNQFFTEQFLYDMIGQESGESSRLVDVQIVPYSPINAFGKSWDGGTIYVNEDGEPEPTNVISLGNYCIPLYEVPYSSFSLEIPYNMSMFGLKWEQQIKYRLTSPSGATVYEFSPSKSGGLKKFKISADLRPYSSFYRIQPNFSNLYGTNYNDTRGLIWQEDMSLTLVSSAFETYKRQNVNYMNSFLAEQSYKRSEQTIQHEANWGNFRYDSSKRIIESVAGAGGQVAFGGAVAGPPGAIGAGIAAGISLVGAGIMEGIEASQLAYNNKMERKLLTNELDHARQQFNYNIGNIKAIPENIEKVSGIYHTNNFVPYLQIFEPTYREKVYFERYIKLYGVNVGQMVNLRTKDFDYLQGTIMRYSGILTNEEYQELSSQLIRGVRDIERWE